MSVFVLVDLSRVSLCFFKWMDKIMTVLRPTIKKTLVCLLIAVSLSGCQPHVEKKAEAETNKNSSANETPAKVTMQIDADTFSQQNRVQQIEQLAGISQAQLIQFDPQEVKQGGETGINIKSSESYSKPSSNISASRKGDFFIGNAFFKQPWVVAPASTDARDGLGALFNVAACQSCHIKDGRGHAPKDADDDADSLLIRLAMPTNDAEQLQALAASKIEKIAHPIYGGQLQDRGIQGVPAEGKVTTKWTDVVVSYADGHKATLRRPTFSIEKLNYGALDESVIISPRVALPMIGLGLLEHIPAVAIEAQADVNDANNDGISGKANQVIDSKTGQVTLGRFGWKAGQPFLVTQNQAAFNGDMGLTSRLNPHENCTATQKACLSAPTGADDQQDGKPPVEISDEITQFVEFYTRNLAVPNRRNAKDAKVLAGKKHFYAMGCVSCHTPRYQLPTTDDDHLEQHGQIIYPYTDMLLHDMGDDLADRNVAGAIPDKQTQVEFLANSHEWRTPALWGIGLAKKVDKHATFLHDGRARTPMEAVLWHGGEAEASKQKVLKLDKQGREELEAFLSSL